MSVPTITSHILDTSRGVPASGVRVVLDFNISELPANEFSWKMMSESVSDSDGRCPGLLTTVQLPIPVGIYRIVFHTQEYFNELGMSSFYPHIEIIFRINNPADHYHVPLILGPYGYSTYRGS